MCSSDLADPAVRAARRAKQDTERGQDGVDVAQTQAALEERDRKDSTREASPLTQGEGVTTLDTTHLSLGEVVDEVVGLVERLP